MQKFYFTFGEKQENEKKYVIIESTSADLAHKKMVDLFGNGWSMQYSEKEWFKNDISQAEEYGYKELKVVN